MKIKKVILRCMLFCIKQLWRVRYKVSYRGLDEVLSVIKNTDKGTLFLPNHPAIFIDPLIIAVPLGIFITLEPPTRDMTAEALEER